MRTIVTPLSKEEKKAIKEMAANSKLSDRVDIVEDIYGFMKQPEMIEEADITEELIDEFVNGKFEYYIPMKQKVKGRIDFFNRIMNHSYYGKFRDLNPDEGACILLDMLNAFYKEKKEQEKDGGGKGSHDEAMREFEDIIRYGRELFDLLDDPWFRKLMEQPESGCGSGQDKKPDQLPQMVKNMVAGMGNVIHMYELSKRLEFTIRASKKGKWNEVPFPDNGMDISRMKKIRDITQLLPSQLALDDDVFLKKLLSKELLKKKYMQRQEKRQILYMIVDSSGSMSDNVLKNMMKIDVCKSVTIALMKKMIENEDFFYFRWFTTGVSPLHKIKTKEEAMDFLPKLVYGQNADGGTNIQNAIRVATEDLKSKQLEHWDLADILLVSDGIAVVNVEECNKMLEGIDMHTIMITHEKLDKNNEFHSNMIQMSKNFMMTNCYDETDVVEIANIFTK